MLFTKKKGKEIRVAQIFNAISNVLTIRSRNKRIPASLGRWSICRDAAAIEKRDQCSNRRLFDKYPHSETRSLTRAHIWWLSILSYILLLHSIYWFAFYAKRLTRRGTVCQETKKIASIYRRLGIRNEKKKKNDKMLILHHKPDKLESNGECNTSHVRSKPKSQPNWRQTPNNSHCTICCMLLKNEDGTSKDEEEMSLLQISQAQRIPLKTRHNTQHTCMHRRHAIASRQTNS